MIVAGRSGITPRHTRTHQEVKAALIDSHQKLMNPVTSLSLNPSSPLVRHTTGTRETWPYHMEPVSFLSRVSNNIKQNQVEISPILYSTIMAYNLKTNVPEHYNSRSSGLAGRGTGDVLTF